MKQAPNQQSCKESQIMEPYQQIFPKKVEPTMTLTLSKKVGRVPKGSYTFIECYCTDPACDCRRVTLLVVNEKAQQKAAISFGFEPGEPMSGPYLDDFQKQAPYAEELIQFFVDAINGDSDWLESMYRQYREVRKKVAGKTYRGKPFPKPGSIKRSVTPPPDLEVELERMRSILEASVRSPSDPRSKKKSKPEHPDLFSPLDASPAAVEEQLAVLLGQYLLMLQHGRGYLDLDALQGELRRTLFAEDRACDALARVIAAAPLQDEIASEAVLRMLLDALEILRVELERRRPGSQRRMEGLQNALAQHVFIEHEDQELCALVTHALLESRVDILPVIHQANNRRMQEGAEGSAMSGFSNMSGDEIATDLCRSIEGMGLPSAFEGMEAMLQLFGLADPEVQIALSGSMLAVGSPFIRDIVVLMLFHPDAEVRRGVAQLLADCDGHLLTPESLRRLIVSRNWFPEEVRTHLDQAIGNARKARVECAPLPGTVNLKVHASVVDGAGAQSFQVIIPDGKGFASCSLLLKRGVGVADGFVVPLKTKRELNDFLAMMKREAGFLEVAPEYLDMRVSHALAEGASLGRAPVYWLVRIAELLGRDQWRAVPFDAQDTLSQLCDELLSENPKLLSPKEAVQSLEDSAGWSLEEAFAASWFEDDVVVDKEIEKSQGKKKTKGVIERILDVVLEKRRAVWLDRLVLSTLWLKSSRKPPVPWHRMLHVAESVADQEIALKEIPLMHSIAELSYTAYLGRKESRKGGF
jgi:hypothetical protein